MEEVDALMTSRLTLRGCVAVLIAWLCAVTMGSVRAPVLSDAVVVGVEAQGPDVGTEAQRESGKTLYRQELFAVPRREG